MDSNRDQSRRPAGRGGFGILTLLVALFTPQSPQSFAQEVLRKASVDVAAKEIERQLAGFAAAVVDDLEDFARTMNIPQAILISSAGTEGGADAMAEKLEHVRDACAARLNRKIKLYVSHTRNGRWAVVAVPSADLPPEEAQEIASCFQASPIITGRCLVQEAEVYRIPR